MTILNQPCPECFREEDGKWFYPCPSDDCVLHAINVTAAPFMLSALEAAYVALDAYSGGESSALMVVQEAIERATK